MKKQGVSMKYEMGKIKAALELYEQSDLSWDEVAEKVGIPKGTLQYHRRQQRKGVIVDEEKQVNG